MCSTFARNQVRRGQNPGGRETRVALYKTCNAASLRQGEQSAEIAITLLCYHALVPPAVLWGVGSQSSHINPSMALKSQPLAMHPQGNKIARGGLTKEMLDACFGRRTHPLRAPCDKNKSLPKTNNFQTRDNRGTPPPPCFFAAPFPHDFHRLTT